VRSFVAKGAFVSVLLITGLIAVYHHFAPQLAVNRDPEQFSLLSKMEKQGVPMFKSVRLDGRPFDSSETRGKIVIINFWASWCNPCAQEFPSLLKLVEEFHGDVILIAVSADDDQQDAANFLKAFGWPKDHIEILIDKDRKIAQLFGVEKLPESFLVGRDQRLIRKVVGIDNWYTEGSIEYFRDLIGKKGDDPKLAK
jgi:thiol-disulfide isomerase/thioredoxin